MTANHDLELRSWSSSLNKLQTIIQFQQFSRSAIPKTIILTSFRKSGITKGISITISFLYILAQFCQKLLRSIFDLCASNFILNIPCVIMHIYIFNPRSTY